MLPDLVGICSRDPYARHSTTLASWGYHGLADRCRLTLCFEFCRTSYLMGRLLQALKWTRQWQAKVGRFSQGTSFCFGRSRWIRCGKDRSGVHRANGTYLSRLESIWI
ncbi:hypothetical protein BT93_K1527 [Corymbia citriodora subsp. variegata]|nr:hypothetical protein BT93_K1527 [Corymbia citriodora subsp. variegata]